MSRACARAVALDVAPRRASVTARRARRATHAAASTSRGGDAARHLYNLLGVSPKATTKEIKSAYRRRALELHPDVNKAPDASARFNEVKEAYNVLVDPARREAYDAAATSRGRATATDWSDAWTRATSGARAPRASSSRASPSSSGARAAGAREEEEFYGFGDFFRDLEKELAARDAARPAGAAPKSLWEELYEIGEEFVDFLEDAAPKPKPTSETEFSRAAPPPKPKPKKPSPAPSVKSQTVDDMLAELKRDMGLQ
jgi:molecular chaperone DnaJ